MQLFARPLNPEFAHDHDDEDDLIEFALHGGGVRTDEQNLAAFAAAGLTEPPNDRLRFRPVLGHSDRRWLRRAHHSG